MIRYSMATDIARGMTLLHSKRLYHGNLKSNNCIIDDRWTVKIAGRCIDDRWTVKIAGRCIDDRWTVDRKSTRLNSSHTAESRMPSSA